MSNRHIPDSVKRSFRPTTGQKEARAKERVEEIKQDVAREVKLPWPLALHSLSVRAIQTVTLLGVIRLCSRTIRKIMVKSIAWVPRAFGLYYAVTGGKVDEREFAQRQSECDSCPDLVRVGEKRYCGPCNCPHWRMSELSSKNRWKRHICPKRRHSQTSYPNFVTISPSGCAQRANTGK